MIMKTKEGEKEGEFTIEWTMKKIKQILQS